jgi:excisionase family DNA binding protein
MAGKFLSLEEAAQALGVGVDEVHRLVDRKRLFPLRDGATIKFKADDIERARGGLDDSLAGSGTLELDLDAVPGGAPPSSPTAVPAERAPAKTPPASDIGLDDLGLDLDSGAAAVTDGGGADAGSWVLGNDDSDLRPGGVSAPAEAGGHEPPATGGPQPAGPDSPLPLASGSFLADDDLALDSLITSSPALDDLSIEGIAGDGGSAPDGLGSALDLSDAAPGGTREFPGGTPGVGSRVIGSDSGVASLSGSLAVPLDSGVSLEDGELQVSGIDLAPASGLGLGNGDESLGGPGSLVGEAFDLGGMDDEESASVVIPTESTGDSSFFENVGDASGSFADSSSMGLAPAGADALGADVFEAGGGMTFSAWQLAGLIASALVLFLGSLVMLDLLWTVRSPGPFISAPLLDALANAFNWR